MRLGEIIDRALVPFAPRLALQRWAARQRFDALTTYNGAKRGRHDKDWNPANKSADGAILPDLGTLTARARQLCRDNGYAKSIRRSYGRNVIGTGITARSSARFSTGKARTTFNKDMDRLWDRWVRKPKACDYHRVKTFWQLQRMAAENLIEVGEFLVRFHNEPGKRGAIALQFEAIEPEQLDLTLTRNPQNNNEIRAGVELDAASRPVAYWVNARTPDDIGIGLTTYRPRRVSAEDIIHLFVQERPGQTRGVTAFAPVLRKVRDLDKFDETQLWTARLEACLGAAITKKDEGTDRSIGLGTRDGETETDDDGNRQLNFEPGMFMELEAGEDVKFFTPTRPGGTYEPFVKAQLRAISAGTGLSYEQTARDFSQGNFSSQRQALLEDRREWTGLQQFFIDALCTPVREQFIQAAVLAGKVQAPGYFTDPESWCECEWMPQGWEWIDPSKEAAAAKISLEQRLTTRKRILNSQGRDWRETMQQIKDEREFADELKIDLPENKAGGPAVNPSEPRPKGVAPTPGGGNGDNGQGNGQDGGNGNGQGNGGGNGNGQGGGQDGGQNNNGNGNGMGARITPRDMDEAFAEVCVGGSQ